jgi:ribose/xylose/arabinose/galactoside ABC-type transport system permease subunit
VVSILGPLAGLAFVFGLFAVLVPIHTSRQTFVTQFNIQVILLQTAIVGTAALGMTLIIISGGIDLSAGSAIALVTVTVAIMLNKPWVQEMSPVTQGIVAGVGGIISAALVGLLIGLMVTQLDFWAFVPPALNVIACAGAIWWMSEEYSRSFAIWGANIVLGGAALGVISWLLLREKLRRMSLAVGAGAAVALGVMATLSLLWHLEWNVLFALLGGIAIVIGVELAWLAAWVLISRVSLPPFIATLCLWGAVRGLAIGLADKTEVAAPPTWLNELLQLLIGESRWMIVAPGVWLMLVLMVLVVLMLRYTRFGRHIYAVGSNEATARLCGVPVMRTKIMIYLTAGTLVGLAGVMQFSSLGMGDPTTATGRELDIIAAVVIGGASLSGGQGSAFSTIIGALIMSVIANGSTKMGWENWQQMIITGGIIALAVTLDQLRQKRTT